MSRSKGSRYKCDCCESTFNESEILTATSPFREDDILTACPRCALTEGFTELCDFCDSRASGGCPINEDGTAARSGEGTDYVRVCHKHWPK